MFNEQHPQQDLCHLENNLQPHQQADENLELISNQAYQHPVNIDEIDEAHKVQPFDDDILNQQSAVEIGQIVEGKPQLMVIENYLPSQYDYLDSAIATANTTEDTQASTATSEFIISQFEDIQMTTQGQSDWKGCVIVRFTEEMNANYNEIQEEQKEYPSLKEERKKSDPQIDTISFEYLIKAAYQKASDNSKVNQEPLIFGQCKSNSPESIILAPNEQYSQVANEINEQSMLEDEVDESSDNSEEEKLEQSTEIRAIEEENKQQEPSQQQIQTVCANFNFYEHRYAFRSMARLSDKILKELQRAQKLINEGKILSQREKHYLKILKKSAHRTNKSRILNSADAWRASLKEMKTNVKIETLKTFLTEQFARDFAVFYQYLIACRKNPPKVRNRRDMDAPASTHRYYRDNNIDKEIQMINRFKGIVDSLYA
ncbi:hypothetical protein FGO68_gene3146 [Halteria grandinella]|uniref:Uncharacterized protein n=1 Tax=Halteria grandinella TaxID=5974 RepID=A0A8J8NTX2_HALGN|nr:hypothetical protein FGO68_gene3146 [Halteria grandinella]